jgi:hypothetical protein
MSPLDLNLTIQLSRITREEVHDVSGSTITVFIIVLSGLSPDVTIQFVHVDPLLPPRKGVPFRDGKV